jgi:hypothetical protein
MGTIVPLWKPPERWIQIIDKMKEHMTTGQILCNLGHYEDFFWEQGSFDPKQSEIILGNLDLYLKTNYR